MGTKVNIETATAYEWIIEESDEPDKWLDMVKFYLDMNQGKPDHKVIDALSLWLSDWVFLSYPHYDDVTTGPLVVIIDKAKEKVDWKILAKGLLIHYLKLREGEDG